jgi:hypothetical protein
MEHLLSLHLKKFNDRIKVMNQTQSKELVLSAGEARQLHADIFDLLTQIQHLAQTPDTPVEPITVQLQGSKF